MKFCAQCPFKWLVLLILILFTTFQKVNSASTQGKCENCTNLKELSMPLVLLGVVSFLFIIICLIRCLPKFTQIMFSSAEQLSAAQREQHTQRLSQILKRQHQLRQSPNCLPGQNDLLEKGIFQDPFLNAGVLGSVLLQPNRLEQQLDEKQQVANGISKSIDLDTKSVIPPPPIRRHQTFAAAGIAATAVSHLLHQQRNNTLRKQVLAKQQQNKLNDSRQKDKTLTPPLTNKLNKPVLTRFLKKSNTVRPVQLQHSLSLTSFAALPKVGQQSQFSTPTNGQFNSNNIVKLNGTKPNLKYNRIDKNVMTINQQPITLDLLYKRAVVEKPQLTDDMQFYSDREELDKHNLSNNRLVSKSVQNIEQTQQPITWLDDSSDISEELPLPAPLPLDLLNRDKRASISRFNQSSLKCRSMPMINQPEHALYTPYYDDDQHDTSLNEDLHHHFQDYPFDSAFDFRNAFRVQNYPPTSTSTSANQRPKPNFNNETCVLHSSLNHLLRNPDAQEELTEYQQLDHRTGLDSSSYNNRNNESYNIEQWPDAQLQQFLNAFNRYTQQQRPSVNRNHTRSLYDLY